jgi:hypothetical protein
MGAPSPEADHHSSRKARERRKAMKDHIMEMVRNHPDVRRAQARLRALNRISQGRTGFSDDEPEPGNDPFYQNALGRTGKVARLDTGRVGYQNALGRTGKVAKLDTGRSDMGDLSFILSEAQRRANR